MKNFDQHMESFTQDKYRAFKLGKSQEPVSGLTMKNVFTFAASILFVDPSELKYHGRSLQRLWYAGAVVAMLGLSCLSGSM